MQGDFTLLPFIQSESLFLMTNRNQSQEGQVGPHPSSPAVCPTPFQEKNLLHESTEAGILGSQQEGSSPSHIQVHPNLCGARIIPLQLSPCQISQQLPIHVEHWEGHGYDGIWGPSSPIRAGCWGMI